MKKKIYVVIEVDECNVAEPEVLGIYNTKKEAKEVMKEEYNSLKKNGYVRSQTFITNNNAVVFDDYAITIAIRECEIEV